MKAPSKVEQMDEPAKAKYKKSMTMQPNFASQDLTFDVMDDPDYPAEAVNSNVIVEEIEMNGRI